jgi:hypothetical protein
MDLYQAMNVADTPTPHKYTYDEAYALNTQLFRAGVRFFFRDDVDLDDEMTYSVLQFCVRNSDAFDTEGCSDAELWSDVIVKAIVDGRIEYAVWGVVQNVQD